MSPLMQEAAKVLQDARAGFHVVCNVFRCAVYKNGEELFIGSETDCHDWIDRECALALLRWHLTREPTEGMVHAGGEYLCDLAGFATTETVTKFHRAMNAALLKEVES